NKFSYCHAYILVAGVWWCYAGVFAVGPLSGGENMGLSLMEQPAASTGMRPRLPPAVQQHMSPQNKITNAHALIQAIFAKSSTLYNPIVYLVFKPNFRKSCVGMWPSAGVHCVDVCVSTVMHRRELAGSLMAKKSATLQGCPMGCQTAIGPADTVLVLKLKANTLSSGDLDCFTLAYLDLRDVSIKGSRGFGVVVLEATARGGVHIMTGSTEDHVTPLAGSHSRAAKSTTLTLHTTMTFEQPPIPCIPRLSGWRSRWSLPSSRPGSTPLSVQVNLIQRGQVVGCVSISRRR
ncbi:hypothetical protein INR49_009082, partial [Caranx melampygus]